MDKTNKEQAPGGLAGNQVIVIVRGGVADVAYKPLGIAVTIRDYDVDGREDSHLERDPDGYAYNFQHYPADTVIDAG